MRKFEQLKRQYHSLAGYLDLRDMSDKNISATTADFDRLFELCWKTLKTYMFEELGIYQAKTGSPREILKLAAAQELLDDERIWLEMLKDRNDDSHIYSRADAVVYMSKIDARYLPQAGRLLDKLQTLIPEEVWEDVQIPEDMLDYSIRHHQPLYRLVEEIRLKYACLTDRQVYDRWEEYKETYLTPES